MLSVGDARAGKVRYAQVPRPVQQSVGLPGHMSSVRHPGGERIVGGQQHVVLPVCASPGHELHRDGTKVSIRSVLCHGLKKNTVFKTGHTKIY